MKICRKCKFIAVILVSLILCSCGIIPEEETFQEVPYVGDYESTDYVLSQCVRMDIAVNVKVTVKYVPLQTLSLSFPVNGIPYGDVYVRAGDAVSAGDLMMELDTEQLLSDVEKEKTSVDTNTRTIRQLEENRAVELLAMQYRMSSMAYDRYLQSVDEINGRYDTQIRELNDNIEISQIRIAAYESDIEDRRLYAPFDGVITYVFSPNPDDVSQTTKRVVTISDSSLSLFKGTTEFFYLFEPGMELTVTSGDSEFEAVVRSEEELGLPETEHTVGRTGTIYLALRETLYTLSDNASGSVTLTQAEKKGALCVPKRAVSEINGKSVVYYPDEYGMRTYKEIEVGLDNGSYVEVISGLEEGDTVIVR